MKTVKRFAASLLLFASLLFTNCTRNYDFPPTTREIITRGAWKVDFYYSGSDRTAQYTSYEFTFHNDGSITCTHGSGSCSGIWNIDRDASGNDVLEVALQTPDPSLKKLAIDWKVAETGLEVVNMHRESADKLRLRRL